MKKWNQTNTRIRFAALTICFFLLLFCKTDSKAVRLSDASISDGVYIGDVDVSGMTEKEAVEAVKTYLKKLRKKEIQLVYGETVIPVKVKKLGFSWANEEIVEKAVKLGKAGNIIERYKSIKDLKENNKVFPLKTSVKKSKIKEVLEGIRDQIDQEAVNAELSKEGDTFIIQDEQTGISLNTDTTAKKVKKAMGDSWNGSDVSVEIAADSIEPKATRALLELVKDVLGTYQTNYSTGSGRSQNVANGASKINGTLLFPGEEFSVYQAVSPFDAENGYELAGSYENGSVVQTYGGGICQVSTTLFNAVLYSELQVTQRSEHSMIVTYVEPSRDAAISGEYKDFKFINNTDAPIYIEGAGVDGILTFTIYGHETRPSNRSIDFESEVTSETASTVTLQASPEEAIGTFTTIQRPHEGKTARLWKVIYEDGVETNREIAYESCYNMSPQIISVGTASPNAAAVSDMNAAISSGDLARCQSVAASYSGAATANADANAAADSSGEDQKSKKKSSKEKSASETPDPAATENITGGTTP